MKKILLLTVAMLSATTAYSACTPPIGKCDCAFPKFENGALTCGESYCKEKTCMPNGSCCTTPNNTKTECCDNYNNGVAKDGSCCPSLLPSDCETEVDETTGCNVCKSSNTCEGKTAFADCGSGKYCAKLNDQKLYCLSKGPEQADEVIKIRNTCDAGEYSSKGGCCWGPSGPYSDAEAGWDYYYTCGAYRNYRLWVDEEDESCPFGRGTYLIPTHSVWFENSAKELRQDPYYEEEEGSSAQFLCME